MVLVLAPSRQTGKEPRRIALRTVALLLGLVAGGSLVGLALGLLGMAAASVLTQAPLAIAAVTTAIAYALADFGFIRLPKAGRHWQVPRRWLSELPTTKAFLFFGILLGIGFLTAAPYASFTSLLALEVGTGSPVAGAVCGAAYGLGRGFAVLLGRRQAAHVDSFTTLIPQVVGRMTRWRPALAASAIAVGLWTLVVAL